MTLRDGEAKLLFVLSSTYPPVVLSAELQMEAHKLAPGSGPKAEGRLKAWRQHSIASVFKF